MADNVKNFTDENFQNEVIQSDLPVLVDFWAPWCGPCQMIAPIVEEIAKQYENKVKIGRLNTDNSPNSAGKYGIMAIPTLLIFKQGKVVEQIVGVRPKEELASLLDKHLSRMK